jgi:hypothetical protein
MWLLLPSLDVGHNVTQRGCVMMTRLCCCMHYIKSEHTTMFCSPVVPELMALPLVSESLLEEQVACMLQHWQLPRAHAVRKPMHAVRKPTRITLHVCVLPRQHH